MRLNIGNRAPQLERGEPAGERPRGLPARGIASEEVVCQRVGQDLGVQLTGHHEVLIPLLCWAVLEQLDAG